MKKLLPILIVLFASCNTQTPQKVNEKIIKQTIVDNNDYRTMVKMTLTQDSLLVYDSSVYRIGKCFGDPDYILVYRIQSVKKNP